MTKSDQVPVTQEDIECFKAIFGFTDETVDPEGDDARALDLIARHRLASQEQAFNAGLEAAAEVADKTTITPPGDETLSEAEEVNLDGWNHCAEIIAERIRAKKGTHRHG